MIISGKRTYRCGYCCDTGYVAIWRPHAMRLQREQGAGFNPLDVAHRLTLPCCCAKGEKITPSSPHYKPSLHPRCFADPERSEGLAEATLATLLDFKSYMPVPVAREMAFTSYDPDKGYGE